MPPCYIPIHSVRGRTNNCCTRIFNKFSFPLSWSHHYRLLLSEYYDDLSMSVTVLTVLHYCYRYELQTPFQKGSFLLTSSNWWARIKYSPAYLESTIRTRLEDSCDVRYWIAHLKCYCCLYFSFISYFTRWQHYQYYSLVYINICPFEKWACWHRFTR